MYAEYSARYEDAHGVEETILRNDGVTLRMRLRGVEFSSATFQDFEAEEGADTAALGSFLLSQNSLYEYVLECDMPLPMVANGEAAEAALHVRIAQGKYATRSELFREEVDLTLHYAGTEYDGSGRSGWFQDELVEIQTALPAGVYMKACITCAFSDYSPYGHQVFGDMACFRNNKAEYLRVASKGDMFRVWYTAAGAVQETYLCPEFQRRISGTGYRG